MIYYSGKLKDGKLKSVEGKSVSALSDGFTPITRAAYDDFIASLPKPTVPDLKAEYAAAPDKIKFMAERMGLI